MPYECGFFFSRHGDVPFTVFQNANAAYLSGSATDVQTPLNIGMENSRSFRGLPVYATLMAYGRDGYEDMLVRQVRLARRVAAWVDGCKGLVLLPHGGRDGGMGEIYIVVLFRAEDEGLNTELVKRVNKDRRIYVSGTKWDGKPACRIAVSNWQVDVERDFEQVKEVLQGVLDK